MVPEEDVQKSCWRECVEALHEALDDVDGEEAGERGRDVADERERERVDSEQLVCGWRTRPEYRILPE